LPEAVRWLLPGEQRQRGDGRLDLERGAAGAAVVGEARMDAEILGEGQRVEVVLHGHDEQAIDIAGRESRL
jgi:hypothetical protein